MASAARPSAPPLPAVQRYFEISLYFLVSTGVLAIVSTGKLDPISTFAPAAAMVYKGYRLWRGRVARNFRAASPRGWCWPISFFFPLDLWFFSRNLADGAPNPALYAGLLSAIHLLLFATSCGCIRRHEPRLRVPGGAGGHVDAGLRDSDGGDGISGGAGDFSGAGGFDVRGAGDAAKRDGRGVAGAFEPGSPLAQQLNRALGITSVLVAVSALALGHGDFFPDSAVHHRLPERAQSAAEPDDRLQRRVHAGRHRENSAEQRGGDARRRSRQCRRWHRTCIGAESCSPISTAIAGSLRSTISGSSARMAKANIGSNRLHFLAGKSLPLHYTVLLEPMATDAIFVAPRAAGTCADDFSRRASATVDFPLEDICCSMRPDRFSIPRTTAQKSGMKAASNLAGGKPGGVTRASAGYPDGVRKRICSFRRWTRD